MKTVQEKFWSSKFGDKYIARNSQDFDKLYTLRFGISRSQMNKDFLKGKRIKNILEVGSNIGNQLSILQKLGYENLYGIEIHKPAIEKAKKRTKDINILYGSAFDLPFKDSYFDIVFTAGVLIHISPRDVKKAMREIYRTSNKYIWGLEYFDEKYRTIEYRNNKNHLWKGNFAKMYMDLFPDLKLIKEERYEYKDGSGNIDSMFLLAKK
ncbi:MAG: methyltransferase domain-containing protein [Candidatus Pacebacteria bacterium]|jgi:pseudaminic acid biosynthesis-associated methylase|nr:methyltransferase domain-containing protein [Candidatus Paceibacterota bacterium]